MARQTHTKESCKLAPRTLIGDAVDMRYFNCVHVHMITQRYKGWPSPPRLSSSSLIFNILSSSIRAHCLAIRDMSPFKTGSETTLETPKKLKRSLKVHSTRNLGKSDTGGADNLAPTVDVYEVQLDDNQASQTLQEPIVLDSDDEDSESDMDDLAKEILKFHSGNSARVLNTQEASQVPAVDGTSCTSSGTRSIVGDGQHQPKDQPLSQKKNSRASIHASSKQSPNIQSPERRHKRPISEHLSTTEDQGKSACKLFHSLAIYLMLTGTSYSNCC
jgi:hypothetical protein